jgi:hypothetical protein
VAQNALLSLDSSKLTVGSWASPPSSSSDGPVPVGEEAPLLVSGGAFIEVEVAAMLLPEECCGNNITSPLVISAGSQKYSQIILRFPANCTLNSQSVWLKLLLKSCMHDGRRQQACLRRSDFCRPKELTPKTAKTRTTAAAGTARRKRPRGLMLAMPDCGENVLLLVARGEDLLGH